MYKNITISIGMRKVVCGAVLVGYCSASLAANSWAQQVVSPPLNRLHDITRYTVQLNPKVRLNPATHVLDRVDITLTQRQAGVVQTNLCVANTNNCVRLSQQHLSTQHFSGLPISTTFELQHRVENWQGGVAPVFIRSALVFWVTSKEP